MNHSRTRRLLASTLVLTACAGPPQEPAPAPDRDLVREITEAEHAWARAIIETDTVALTHLLAPEFALVGVSDSIPPFPRAAWMANLATRRVYTDSVVIDSLRVTGTADSAIATMRYYWRPIVGGQRMPAEWVRLRDTWVWRDGRWQTVQRRRLDPMPPAAR